MVTILITVKNMESTIRFFSTTSLAIDKIGVIHYQQQKQRKCDDANHPFSA